MIVPVECKVLPDELIQDNIGVRHARPHILRIIERREDFGTHLGAHLVPNAATGETLAEGSLKLGCGHRPKIAVSTAIADLLSDLASWRQRKCAIPVVHT